MVRVSRRKQMAQTTRLMAMSGLVILQLSSLLQKLDLVAEDKTPNNGLSATWHLSQEANGDKFYVAYHTNGVASNGAIEAIRLAKAINCLSTRM